jgi:hypothetical protein
MDLTGACWRTSSYSGNNGGNCVQVATNLPQIIAVRDSKDPHGAWLTFPADAWRLFTDSVKAAALSR